MDIKTAPKDCFPCKFGKATFKYTPDSKMIVWCVTLGKELPERHSEKDGPCPYWEPSPAIRDL